MKFPLFSMFHQLMPACLPSRLPSGKESDLVITSTHPIISPIALVSHIRKEPHLDHANSSDKVKNQRKVKHLKYIRPGSYLGIEVKQKNGKFHFVALRLARLALCIACCIVNVHNISVVQCCLLMSHHS